MLFHRKSDRSNKEQVSVCCSETIIDHTWFWRKKPTESPYVADLTTVLTIYIYCDIVEPQIVGDTSAQLLKSIPAEGRFGDIIAKTFTNIQYVPIRTKSFEVVEVLLRNDPGYPVPFERGKVVITLHFEKHIYFT